MKIFRAISVMFSLGFALSAGAANLTTEPLTGLPLHTGTEGNFTLANQPVKMPDSQICKSKVQANDYSVYDGKVDAVVAWYAAHLAGLHKTHAYADGRSQDSFYNDAGTMAVLVMGDPGKEGENKDAFAVVYYHYQPGLSAKSIISVTQQKITCP